MALKVITDDRDRAVDLLSIAASSGYAVRLLPDEAGTSVVELDVEQKYPDLRVVLDRDGSSGTFETVDGCGLPSSVAAAMWDLSIRVTCDTPQLQITG